jgi:hypothetical protein
MLSTFVALILGNKALAALGAVCIIDGALVISGLAGDVPWRHWFLEENASSRPTKYRLTSLGIAHVVGWTIAPPIWFFLEAFTIDAHLLPSAARSTNPHLMAEYDRFRVAQDLASKVWAAILAAILFLVPK